MPGVVTHRRLPFRQRRRRGNFRSPLRIPRSLKCRDGRSGGVKIELRCHRYPSESRSIWKRGETRRRPRNPPAVVVTVDVVVVLFPLPPLPLRLWKLSPSRVYPSGFPVAPLR